MIKTKIYNPTNKPTLKEKDAIVSFLYTHLEEFRDPKSDIEKAVDYAMKEVPSFGGFILVSTENSELSGAVVINQTGMSSYIPENILVYIATHIEHRGKGIGKKLMAESFKLAKGDIALHVEPDNPARFLYEKMGMTNKYIEMRYKKSAQKK